LLKYRHVCFAFIQDAIRLISDGKMMGFSIPDSLVIEWPIAALVLTGIFIIASGHGAFGSTADFATSMDLDGHNTARRGSFIRLYLEDFI
jgi:hypothetical protein